MMSGSHLSKDFFDLVKNIGESRSKQEEDKIVSQEVRVLKEKMASKNVPAKKMKEYLIRMIYVEMLGHDASFGHIHGIKMASERKLLQKRVGYLAVSLTLHSDHSFMLLLVNTIQSDLRSDNFLEASMALTVVCKMVSMETIPALLPLVITLLDHKQPNIRKKAVMALHRFHQIDPSCIQPIIDKVRKVLCDRDPAVMGASLSLFQDMAANNTAPLKDLVPSFVSILKQVTEHRLPREYDYHRMPAPWIQLSLLQILAILGTADRSASEGMYEILHEVIKRADIGINVGYAIVYECVRTVTQIYPDQSLIEDAALAISRFITSENHNLKYLGVNSLASIVQIDPKYAAEHQLLVIDCLEDPDETLRRKTLDLLYSMTNSNNVLVIVDKLIGYLGNTTDVYLRTDLVSRINQLSEKFSPNTWWYIETCNRIFEIAGNLVKPEVAHNLMRLIAEAEEVVEDEAGNEIDIRTYTIEIYLEMINKPSLPDLMTQVIVWVLGEFGQMSSSRSVEEIIAILIEACDKHYDDVLTRSWILTALMKLAAVTPSALEMVKGVAGRFQSSANVDLQQRAHEFLELAKVPQTMTSVLPRADQMDDVDIDEDLSFLTGYVNAALAAGARAYQEDRELKEAASTGHSFSGHSSTKEAGGLRFEAYEKPQEQSNNVAVDWNNPNAGMPDPTADFGRAAASSSGFGAPSADSASGFDLRGKKKMWGPSGFNADTPAAEPEPVTAPAPAINMFASAPAAAPAAVPEPRKFEKKMEAPRELTEKEKMANALFGGGGSMAARPKARVVARAPTTHRRTPSEAAAAAPAPVASATAAAPTIDLFGGMASSAAAAPAPAVAPAAAGPIDLLGFDMPVSSSPAPAQTPPPAQPSPPAPGRDLVDLLGDVFSSPGGAQPVMQVPAVSDPFAQMNSMMGGMSMGGPAPSSEPSMDPFASINGGGSSSGAAGDLLGGFGAAPRMDLGSAGMSAGMRQRLASFPKGKEQVLLTDQTLHISCIKFYCDDRTLLVLFVSNKRPAPIANVGLALNCPAGLAISFDGEPQPQVRTQNGNYLNIPSIPALGTATQIVSLQCIDVTWITDNPVIAGQASFSGSPTKLPFTASLNIRDMLRPAPMSTQQYGAFWKQYTSEVKIQVPQTTVTHSNDFMSRVQNELNIHPVQTIGQENIVAGTLVSGQQNLNLLCFMHGKVKAGPSLDIIIRTKAPTYSQAVARYSSQVFK